MIDDRPETRARAGHPVRWDDELPRVEDPFGNRIELIAADPEAPGGR